MIDVHNFNPMIRHVNNLLFESLSTRLWRCACVLEVHESDGGSLGIKYYVRVVFVQVILNFGAINISLMVKDIKGLV